MEMRHSTRLRLIIGAIIGSVLYAILVINNPEAASAAMLGYVGVLLTIFALNEFWRWRP